jgi:uncharacterized protein
MRIMVLADTHLRQGVEGLPILVADQLHAADVVLHAGDVVSQQLLDDLAGAATLHAVRGNNDHHLDRLPERLEITIEGVRVAMVHDSGARPGRAARMRRWFPTADLVVFGHSHEPVDEQGIDGQRLFNPGSPTQRRRQPHPTVGWLELVDGQIADHRIEPLR